MKFKEALIPVLWSIALPYINMLVNDYCRAGVFSGVAVPLAPEQATHFQAQFKGQTLPVLFIRTCFKRFCLAFKAYIHLLSDKILH